MLEMPPAMVYHPPPTPPAVQVRVWAWAKETTRINDERIVRNNNFFI
jgi:hypothetical protein